MGRPLKIAKAQAVITLTNTTASNDQLTVSSTTGLESGMRFVVATTTGGLTAGTIYWILQVIDGTHFTASDVPPSANTTSTPYALSNAGPVTVALTVYPVDTGYNNPAGVSNTYGIVGGNTAIYGKQVLARVAISVAGAGTIYADTGSAVVSGVGTDFGTDLAIGDAIVGPDGTNLGFVTSIGGAIAMTTVGTDATSDEVEVDDTTGLVAEGGVVFGAAIGGLFAGVVYYVETVVDGTHFTVSATPGGALLPLTTTTVVTSADQDTVTLVANSAAAVSDGAYTYSTSEDGYIVRQKGSTKYLVKGLSTGRTGSCYTANLADAALTPGTMSITATKADTTTVRLQEATDYFGLDFSDNPYYLSFNAAAAANAGNGQPYPIVQVDNQ